MIEVSKFTLILDSQTEGRVRRMLPSRHDLGLFWASENHIGQPPNLRMRSTPRLRRLHLGKPTPDEDDASNENDEFFEDIKRGAIIGALIGLAILLFYVLLRWT
jgi:hypothetical protein